MAVLNPYNYSKPAGYNPRVNKPVARPVQRQPQRQQSGGREGQYLEQKVMQASPEELTFMLYEGAIKFLKQAKIFNNEKDIVKTSKAILRVHAIFDELQCTLDMDYEISKQLDSLYDYILRRLTDANIKKDNDILDEVLELAEELKDTWKEAMILAKTK